MPAAWVTAAAAVVGTASAADSARKSRNAQNSATSANSALSQQQFDEDKRRFDADREDKWTLFNAQMAGDEELDRRNRADAERIDTLNRTDKERSYQRVRGDNVNAINRGDTAGNQLSYRMGLGGTGTGVAGGLNERYKDFNFEKEPGYDFRMGEGQQGVNNKFAQSGSLLSGAAAKALTRFNQDYASNEYSNAYGRYSNDRSAFNTDNANEYNRLSGIQAAGQNATNSVAGVSGTIQGSSQAGSGSNAMSGLANSLGQTSAQQGAASSNYYNNLMGNNNANANSQSAYNSAYGNAIGGGLGSIASAWNSYQNKNNAQTYYSPVQDNGYSTGTGSAYGGQRAGL